MWVGIIYPLLAVYPDLSIMRFMKSEPSGTCHCQQQDLSLYGSPTGLIQKISQLNSTLEKSWVISVSYGSGPSLVGLFLKIYIGKREFHKIKQM